MATRATWFQRLPFLDRRRRRLAVVAAFSGFPLVFIGYATLVATGVLPTAVWGVIVVLLFAMTIVGLVVVYGYGRGRTGDSGPLDEREQQMLDRALVVGYGAVITFAVLVLGAIAVYLSFVGPITITMNDLGPIALAVALYLPLLPFAALAWIEPDVPAEEDDPDLAGGR
jgi:amino acid transporter